MKTLDVKSLLIGALLTSTIFLGIAATGPKEAWDNEQVWQYGTLTEYSLGGKYSANLKYIDTKTGATALEDLNKQPKGWEPINLTFDQQGNVNTTIVRRRIK